MDAFVRKRIGVIFLITCMLQNIMGQQGRPIIMDNINTEKVGWSKWSLFQLGDHPFIWGT